MTAAAGEPKALIAAVLAGGQGRRFGGEKCLAPFNGKSMARWVLDAAEQAGLAGVVIANRPELYAQLGWPVYPDLIPGMGPLSGLYTAFQMSGAQEVFLIAGDMPLADSSAIRYILRRAKESSASAVIPAANGKEQGLFALYRRRALEPHLSRILAGSIQFDEFRASLQKTIISQEELRDAGIGLKTFVNINTRDDLEVTQKGTRHSGKACI